MTIHLPTLLLTMDSNDNAGGSTMDAIASTTARWIGAKPLEATTDFCPSGSMTALAILATVTAATALPRSSAGSRTLLMTGGHVELMADTSVRTTRMALVSPRDDAPERIVETYVNNLKLLTDGWDGEDAAAPSGIAIARANHIMTHAIKHGLLPSDVDPDVLGGVAIWFSSTRLTNDGAPTRLAWLSCMNNGSTTLVLQDKVSGTISAREIANVDFLEIVEFVNGTST